jgi:hypothetical protein
LRQSRISVTCLAALLLLSIVMLSLVVADWYW